MDVTKFLPVWLTVDEIARRGGRYVGTVADVRENRTRNRYRFVADASGKAQAVFEDKLLVVFADGAQLIPNVAALRLLVDRLGPESNAWLGARLAVVVEKGTNGRPERVVEVLALPPSAAAPPPIERSDYDDSGEALAEAGVLLVDDKPAPPLRVVERRPRDERPAITADDIWGRR